MLPSLPYRATRRGGSLPLLFNIVLQDYSRDHCLLDCRDRIPQRKPCCHNRRREMQGGMPRRQATRGSPSGEHGRSVRHRHGWSSQHRILPGAWAAPGPCRRGKRRPARNGAKPWRKSRSRPGAPSPPRRARSRHERTEGTTAARTGPCPPCRPRRWPSSPLKALPAVSGIDWRLALESVDGKHDRLQKRAASFVREDGTAPAILRASLEAATTSACGRWPTSPGRARPAWAHSTWPPSPATWNWTCAAAG